MRPLPRIVAALQFPSFRDGRRRSMAWLEDYLLANAAVFVENGVRAVKLQDETRETGPAAAQTIARMAALCRLFRRTYPDVALGVIVQAHDAEAPLAIADAADADFVRLKVFVGAAVNAEGLRTALSTAALDRRDRLGRRDIRILADVHDRTSAPLGDAPTERAALWAQGAGADAVILTGHSFADSIERVAAARRAGVAVPIAIGGGVDAGNVTDALAVADMAIVSTALLRRDADTDDIVRWDRDAVRRLMEAVPTA